MSVIVKQFRKRTFSVYEDSRGWHFAIKVGKIFESYPKTFPSKAKATDYAVQVISAMQGN